ncbi:hypothetical protein [Amycolatopsis sp. NPDC051903]|uniref:hypothetical protein n=1 Tax=Amycolatopsis sp. NPDC051903 TaxID=3363936 RepID=UPI00379AD9EA
MRLLANLTVTGVWLGRAWEMDPQEVLGQLQYLMTEDDDSEEDSPGRGLPAYPNIDPDEPPAFFRIAQVQYEIACADRAGRALRPARPNLRIVHDA